MCSLELATTDCWPFMDALAFLYRKLWFVAFVHTNCASNAGAPHRHRVYFVCFYRFSMALAVDMRLASVHDSNIWSTQPMTCIYCLHTECVRVFSRRVNE